METDLTLKYIFNVFKKYLIFIIIFNIIFCVGTVFLTVYIIKPTYISSVKLYVVPKSETDKVINSDINDLNYAQKVVNTYIEILKTNVFFNKVAEE
jgi:capsular polysaccharide biosynthesis protein